MVYFYVFSFPVILISQAQFREFNRNTQTIGTILRLDVLNPSSLNVHLDPSMFQVVLTIGDAQSGVQYEIKKSPIQNLTQTIISPGFHTLDIYHLLELGNLYNTIVNE